MRTAGMRTCAQPARCASVAVCGLRHPAARAGPRRRRRLLGARGGRARLRQVRAFVAVRRGELVRRLAGLQPHQLDLQPQDTAQGDSPSADLTAGGQAGRRTHRMARPNWLLARAGPRLRRPLEVRLAPPRALLDLQARVEVVVRDAAIAKQEPERVARGRVVRVVHAEGVLAHPLERDLVRLPAHRAPAASRRAPQPSRRRALAWRAEGRRRRLRRRLARPHAKRDRRHSCGWGGRRRRARGGARRDGPASPAPRGGSSGSRYAANWSMLPSCLRSEYDLIAARSAPAVPWPSQPLPL